MSPQDSISLKELESYFNLQISSAYITLTADVIPNFPGSFVPDPTAGAAIVHLLSGHKPMQLRPDEKIESLTSSGLLEVDRRVERIRMLPLAIEDLFIMKEREIQLLKGQPPVQKDRSKFTSHASIRKYYHAKGKKLNDELAIFVCFDRYSWGTALWGKWFETIIKFRDLVAEKERERALGEHKGWGSGDFHSYEQSEDEDEI